MLRPEAHLHSYASDPTLMDTHKNIATDSFDPCERTTAVRFLFRTVIAAVQQNAATFHDRPFYLVRLKDEFGRFLLWAANCGALHRKESSSSLTYRLRHSTFTMKHILRNLTELANQLQELLSISLGLRNNRSTTNTDSAAPENFDFDVSSSSSESSAEASPSRSARDELDVLLLLLASNVTSLLRATAYIHSASALLRERQIDPSRALGFDKRFDIMHLKQCYPMMADWLVDRLAIANVKRREYFAYRSGHHDRIADQVSRDTDSKIAPVSADLTKATSFQEAGDDALKLTMNTRPLSVMSGATSVGETTRLKFPDLPRHATEEVPFQCPFCFIILDFQGTNLSRSWERHILHDLKPYVCTLENCTASAFASRGTWFEHEMDEHRSRWLCPFCEDANFENQRALTRHLELHKEVPNSSSTSSESAFSVYSTCRIRPLALVPADCPICCSEWTPSNESSSGEAMVTIEQLRKHVGAHLVEIALFSLPKRVVDDEQEISPTRSSASSNIRKLTLTSERDSLMQYEISSWHSSDNHSEEGQQTTIQSGGPTIDDPLFIERQDETYLPDTEESTRHAIPQNRVDHKESILSPDRQTTSSPPPKLVDPPLFWLPTIDGDLDRLQVRGSSTEGFDSNFYVRQDGYSFFKPGRVFKILWAQPAGADQKAQFYSTVKQSGNIYPGMYQEPIHNTLRWMLVTFNKRGYCICCPITTYGGKGLVGKNIPRQEIQSHAIIHTDGYEAQVLPGEPKMSKDPIPVVMARDQPPFDPASRVHFGKHHTVEWNVKVMDIGYVKPNLISTIQYYFLKGFNAKPTR